MESEDYADSFNHELANVSFKYKMEGYYTVIFSGFHIYNITDVFSSKICWDRVVSVDGDIEQKKHVKVSREIIEGLQREFAQLKQTFIEMQLARNKKGSA